MKRALIIIDYTNDFVDSDGALTCGPPAQALEKYIHDVTETFINEEELVVFGVDVHEEGDPYHPETALFPPHNIRGTKGRELYGSLQRIHKENKHKANTLYMDKTRYSAFAGTELNLKLRERGITELHLVGVCTDICVLHTAIDAYNLGYNIHVHKNGVASFNETGHSWALTHFETTLGAKIH